MAVDPVCKMTVDPPKAAAQSSYKGADLLLLRGGLQAEVRPRARPVSGGRQERDGPLMRDPALLEGRARYERVMHGWVDNLHEDALTHTVRLSDDDRGLEVAIVALPSPSYLIHEARLTPLTGDVAPSVVAGFARLAGAALVGGLTRQVADARRRRRRRRARRRRHDRGRAPRPSGGQDAARRRPSARPRAIRSECWQLDTTGWVELPNSCFAYSDAGRSLFGTRTVARRCSPTSTARGRGSARVRAAEGRATGARGRAAPALPLDARQRARLRDHLRDRSGHAGGSCAPSTSRRDCRTWASARSRSGGSRRCSARRPTPGCASASRATLGGEHGCGQLYDLTADLLKLLA